jgi:hypothetical protein
MTLRRDPFSAPGAWFDACDTIGWGTTAKICGKSESTLRSWAVPDGGGPPRWAMEKVDQALHDRHQPKINTRALDVRTGGEPPSVLVLLADAERSLRLTVRMLDGAQLNEERDFLAIMAAALEVGEAVNDVRQRALIKRTRHLDDLKAKQEAAAELPRFPERPALRSVGGKD